MSAEVDVSDVVDYPIRAGEPVDLTIEVLFRQVGEGVIIYRDKVKAYDGPTSLPTGDRIELCRTRTLVKDVAPEHDRTRVRYRLTGGVRDEEWVYDALARPDGLVTYRITFVFIPA